MLLVEKQQLSQKKQWVFWGFLCSIFNLVGEKSPINQILAYNVSNRFFNLFFWGFFYIALCSILNPENNEPWAVVPEASANDVDSQRNDMLKTLDNSIKDNPEQLEQIKHIVNDWADMKIKSFKDRRSWVRNPDDEE